MRRSWMMWPGGLLALGLTLGCRHTQPQPEGCCSTCNNPAPATQPAPVSPAPTKLSLVPTTPPLVPAPQSVLTDDLPPITVPSRMPLAAAPKAAAAPTQAAAPQSIPLVPSTPVAPRPVTINPEQSAPPAQSAPVPVPVIVQKPVLTERGATPAPAVMPKAVLTERGATPAPSTWTIPQATEHVPTPVVTSAPTPAPSATNSAATGPAYYNSPDYSILFGVLDYNRRTGTWKVRFADAGEEDRYGGSVTLDGIGRQMQEYASGQTVRIEGSLVDPDSKDVSPAYRVKEMRPVTTGK